MAIGWAGWLFTAARYNTSPAIPNSNEHETITMSNSFIRTGARRSPQRLDSLEIQNFRAFHRLAVEKLGNVNLIVGKNSVGKSALLEALRLYAAQGLPEVIADILQDRDEWTVRRSGPIEVVTNKLVPVNSLFYGRQRIDQNRDLIRIGPLHSADKALLIGISWGVTSVDERGRAAWEQISMSDTDELDSFLSQGASDLEPRLVVQFGSEREQYLRLDRDWTRAYYRGSYDLAGQSPTPAFIPITGLSIDEVVKRWEEISLSDAREFVVGALRIIIPNVESIDITGRTPQSYAPVVQARLVDAEQPVPLRSLGEGMSRLFGLALALATAQDTMLLVDEIDSGLHFSVLMEVWRMIFAMAESLNVQVFATTHSWDCVEAFQHAAAENERQDGILIRLQREGDQILPVIVDEETLAIVTSRQIEVR